MSDEKKYWWKCTCNGPYSSVSVRRTIDEDHSCPLCGKEMKYEPIGIEGCIADIFGSKSRPKEESNG